MKLSFQEHQAYEKQGHFFSIHELAKRNVFSSRFLQEGWHYEAFGERGVEVLKQINEHLRQVNAPEVLPAFSGGGNQTHYVTIDGNVFIEVKYTDEWIVYNGEGSYFQGIAIERLFVKDVDAYRFFVTTEALLVFLINETKTYH